MNKQAMPFCLPTCKEHKKQLQFFDFSMIDQKKAFCENCKRPNNLITLGSLKDQLERLKDEEIKSQKDQVKRNQDLIIDFKERMEKIFRIFDRELKSFESFSFQADQLCKQLDNIINTGNKEINLQNLYEIVSPKITITQDYVQINKYSTPQFQDYSDLFDSLTKISQSHLKPKDPAGKTINQTLKNTVISTNQNQNTYSQSPIIQQFNNNQQVNQQTGRMTTSNYLTQTQRNPQIIQQTQQIVKMATNIPIVQQSQTARMATNIPVLQQSIKQVDPQFSNQLSNQIPQYQGNFICVKHGKKFEKVSFGEQVALYCSNCVPQGQTISFEEFNLFIQSLKARENSSPSDIIISSFIEWQNEQIQMIHQQIQQMQDRIINSLKQYQIQTIYEHCESQFYQCLEQQNENGILELFQILKNYLHFDSNKIYHISQTLNGLKMFKKLSDDIILKQFININFQF
ncbi:hypothetical protein pb186bvf_020219 [Paramecium bursaria]